MKMHALTSSLLNALAFGQHEWFMQLCKGKNAVPANEILSGRVILHCLANRNMQYHSNAGGIVHTLTRNRIVFT